MSMVVICREWTNPHALGEGCVAVMECSGREGVTEGLREIMDRVGGAGGYPLLRRGVAERGWISVH